VLFERTFCLPQPSDDKKEADDFIEK